MDMNTDPGVQGENLIDNQEHTPTDARQRDGNTATGTVALTRPDEPQVRGIGDRGSRSCDAQGLMGNVV